MIPVNNNTPVSWETLLSKLNQASGTQNTTRTQGANGVTAGSNITITAKVDGTDYSVTFPVPSDLELPGVVDQEAIDTLCEKLSRDSSLGLTEADVKAIHAGLTDALNAVSSSIVPNSKSVMFDIYKLMILLVEVGQKQRDAARDIRAANSAQIQKSIQNQADEQKTAALTGMIAGAICCAIQVITTGIMLAKQGAAFKQQIGTLQTSGVDSAKQNLTMVKTASTPEAAQNQLHEVAASAGQKPGVAPGRTVQQEIDADGFTETTRAQDQLAQAKTKLANDTAELQKCERITNGDQLRSADLPDGPLKTAVAKYEAYQQKVEAAGVSMEEADTFAGKMAQANDGTLSVRERIQLFDQANLNPALKEIGTQTSAQLKADIQSAAQARIAELQVQIPNDTTAVEVARLGVRSSAKTDLQRFEDEFHNALRDVNGITSDTPAAEAAQLRNTLSTAEARLQYARAYANNELAKPGITTPAERAADVKAAGNRVDAAEQARHLDMNYLKASRKLQVGEARLGIVSAVGNVLQSFISNLTSYLQAEAKEDEANQTKAQEELDQIKDLFQQAQSVVDAVIQLMQAISSAETQSMHDAIQA